MNNDKFMRSRNVDQVWHEWINGSQSHERSLYEFKTMLQEVQRLPHWFKREREGNLPKTHQQCSVSAHVEVKGNKLICALGVKCSECPILKSLSDYFSERRKFYTRIQDEDLDTVKAKVCCWHIYQSATKEGNYVDTSEGYVLDESDRMFWNNVYESLASDQEPPEAH